MKLSADKQSLWVNESLTLAQIPPQTFEYRLGSRSALDWIINRYQIKGDSDPNREEDPGYIVRLVGQDREIPLLPSVAFRSSAITLMGSGIGSIPMDGIVKSIDELMQATMPGGLEIATNTFPLP